jgi:AcrR family transcriptional regulator
METSVRTRRLYRMAARAAAAAANGERIRSAAAGLFGELLYDQVSLELIADRAGVTVRTVARRFGSKERLFAEVADWRAAQIRAERTEVAAGDVRTAVRVLVAGYETWGDTTLNFLIQEARTDAIAQVVRSGRRFHHAWVERVFAPLLAGSPPAARRRRLAELKTVTDVYTWKVLRRDLQLGAMEVEHALLELITGVIG